MATASVTYTFAAGEQVASAKFNTNFQQILTFLNNECVQKDGTTAFTVVPSGPASDPTSANQFTRKAYVDQYTGILSRRVQTSPSFYSDTSSTDLGISLPSFTMPTVSATHPLLVELEVPWTEVASLGSPDWNNGSHTCEIWFNHSVSGLQQKKRFTPGVSLLTPTEGAGFYMRWFVFDNLTFAAASTMAIDLRGKLAGGGKYRLGCSASNPLYITARVV